MGRHTSDSDFEIPTPTPDKPHKRTVSSFRDTPESQAHPITDTSCQLESAAVPTSPDSSRQLHRRVKSARGVLAGFLAVCFILTIAGLLALWPGKTEPNISNQFTQNTALSHAVVNGTVAIRDSGPCGSPSVGRVFDETPTQPMDKSGKTCEEAIINITSGSDAGKRTLLLVSDKPGDIDLQVGDKITMAQTTTQRGETGYTILDLQRGNALIMWGVITALAVILIGSWRGLRSLLGLIVTLAIVLAFLLPALLRGGQPLLLALVCGSAVLFAALYLVHGFSWKTSSALGGTLISLGLAAVLAQYAITGTHLRGLGSEDNLLIQLYLPDVTVTGLMLCGFIIGSLGVLNDMTVSQASTVNELAHLDPSAHPWRLFTGAIRVGRDHIASIMYTLVLGYTGAALPLLLLLTAAGRPITQVLTSDIMATEMLRSAVGALALTLAVPITTAIAAFTVTGAAATGHIHKHD